MSTARTMPQSYLPFQPALLLSLNTACNSMCLNLLKMPSGSHRSFMLQNTRYWLKFRLVLSFLFTSRPDFSVSFKAYEITSNCRLSEACLKPLVIQIHYCKGLALGYLYNLICSIHHMMQGKQSYSPPRKLLSVSNQGDQPQWPCLEVWQVL
jgi:hypothetical protein